MRERLTAPGLSREKLIIPGMFRVIFTGEESITIIDPEDGHAECASDGVGGFFEFSGQDVNYMETIDGVTQVVFGGNIPNTGDKLIVETKSGPLSVERLS